MNHAINARAFIGKAVTVADRPLHSRHPEHGFAYELNYGFIPGMVSGDGEELDAYVMGLDEPVKTFTGRCVAVIHRTNDDDDKLVIVPKDTPVPSRAAIRAATQFQEQFFDSVIYFD